jgi:hypothetical protein
MKNNSLDEILNEDAEFILPYIKKQFVKLKDIDYIRPNINKKLNDKLMFKEYFKRDDEKIKKAIFDTIAIISRNIGELTIKNQEQLITRHHHIDYIKKTVFGNKLEFDLVFIFVEFVISYSKHLSKKEITKEKNKQQFTYESELKLSDTLILNLDKHYYPIPMTNLPIDWYKAGYKYKGGYNNYQFELVSVKSNKQPRISEQVLESINYIQSTKWEVNIHLLKEIENNLLIPNIKDIKYNKYQKPDSNGIDFYFNEDPKLLEHNLNAPSGLGTNYKFYENAPKKFYNSQELKIEKEKKEKYFDLLKKYNSNIELYNADLSKYRNIKLAIDIANKFKDQSFYFPHRFDSRGRVYPLAIGLNPQGNDAIKSMLIYSKGEKLTNSGEDWCWAYMTTLYGEDKITFKERVIRGKELLHYDYLNADKPYQFLSHQLEMQKYTKDNSYEVKTRIHLDACNSGSQLISAITNDLFGMRSTNVLPTISGNKLIRQDLYQEIADDILDALKTEVKILNYNGIELEYHNDFIELLEKHGRKICKIPVMTFFYGASSTSINKNISKLINELGLYGDYSDIKNLRVLTELIISNIEERLEGNKKIFIYLRGISEIISNNKKFPTWNSLDGFEIIVKKMEIRTYQKIITFLHKVDTLSDSNSVKMETESKTTTIEIGYESNIIDKIKIKSSIVPNYIHSLDATLLRMTALEMKNQGIVNSSWIHDSFGCSPNNVEKMFLIIKQQFIKLIESNPLNQIIDTLDRQARINNKPNKELDKLSIFKNDDKYDINDILKSEWIFS